MLLSSLRTMRLNIKKSESGKEFDAEYLPTDVDIVRMIHLGDDVDITYKNRNVSKMNFQAQLAVNIFGLLDNVKFSSCIIFFKSKKIFSCWKDFLLLALLILYLTIHFSTLSVYYKIRSEIHLCCS